MTTLAHGPYEHVGAYADLAESERFDTSGTPKGFCPSCEHAPCIAELRRAAQGERCWESPRALSVQRVSWPIIEAGHLLQGQAWDVFNAMEIAVHQLNAFAIHDQSPATRELALQRLVQIRDDMRRVVAS